MKKGDNATMLFHFAGLTSKEACVVSKVHKDNTVTLDNGHRFNVSTGVCVNDNTYMGARRELDVPKPKAKSRTNKCRGCGFEIEAVLCGECVCEEEGA